MIENVIIAIKKNKKTLLNRHEWETTTPRIDTTKIEEKKMNEQTGYRSLLFRTWSRKKMIIVHNN